MDLSYGSEYKSFREEVRRFIEDNKASAPRAGIGVAAGRAGGDLIGWQAKLIEHGYAARNIPREYGGYGAEPDILKRVILDEELNAAGVSRGIGGQGPELTDRGVPVPRAMREARVWGMRQKHLPQALRKLDQRQLLRALVRAAEIDRMVKGLAKGDVWDSLLDLGMSLMPQG